MQKHCFINSLTGLTGLTSLTGFLFLFLNHHSLLTHYLLKVHLLIYESLKTLGIKTCIFFAISTILLCFFHFFPNFRLVLFFIAQIINPTAIPVMFTRIPTEEAKSES